MDGAGSIAGRRCSYFARVNAVNSPSLSLSEFVRAYTLQRELERSSIEQLRIAVRLFERFAGGPIPLVSLTDDLLNGFLQSLHDLGRSSHTRRTKRAAILCLWRAAADEGKCEPPRKIRKIKHGQRVIRAYGIEHMQRLLGVVRQQAGYFQRTGIARSLWWESLLLAYWDTALRLSDLLRVEHSWVGSDGTLELVQHKTSRAHRAQLGPTALAAINLVWRQGIDRRVIWPLWARREEFYKTFKRFKLAADLPEASSSKWIRRGSASAIEAQAPGTAWRHLGHARPGLDRQAYLDRSICDPPPQLPPAIE